jgi:hypothetical protein
MELAKKNARQEHMRARFRIVLAHRSANKGRTQYIQVHPIVCFFPECVAKDSCFQGLGGGALFAARCGSRISNRPEVMNCTPMCIF